MKIAILGRTRWLLDAADTLAAAGHRIVFVATAPAAPEYGVGPSDFGALASAHHAPFYDQLAANDPEFARKLISCEADVGISVNWPTLIGNVTCNALRHGILNAHAGDLPRYRGNACPNWAILNDETRIGVCIHRMDPYAVDAGPIFARRFLTMTASTYIGDVYEWISAVVPGLFIEAVENLANSSFVPEDPSHSGVRPLRCHPRRPEDGRIEWSQPAEQIQRLVRASSRPFRGAFSWLDGGPRVTVWRASVALQDVDVLAVPGQVVGRSPRGGVLVACGRGLIEIEEAVVEGGAKLPAANRHRLTPLPAGSETFRS